MPSFTSPSPPGVTTVSPSANRTSPASAPTISTPVAAVDNSPPPAATERVGGAPNDSIDRSIFDQVLELDDEDGDEDDDDDENEDVKPFSKGMVKEFLAQAEKTLSTMEDALEKKDLAQLSSLGHFLKGSSAALGVFHVQASCEDIQHYGQLREGSKVITEADAIVKIGKSIARARKGYEDAKIWLEWFYASYCPGKD